MNKKIILSISALVFAVSASSVFAAPCPLGKTQPPPPPVDEAFGPPPPQSGPFKMSPQCMEKMKKEHEKRKAEFDKRLKLTDEQKATIEKNRVADREKMKPVFEEIKAKKIKLQEVYSSSLAQIEKDKQIVALKAELKVLKTKAHALREENMKNFEAVLTPVQKTEFEKMKKEHRAEMDKKMKKFKKQGCPCPNPHQSK